MGHVASLPIKLKAHYITQLLEVGVAVGWGAGGGRPRFHPSEKTAVSLKDYSLPRKTAPRNTPLQPAVSDMAVSSPRYLKCGVNVYSHF